MRKQHVYLIKDIGGINSNSNSNLYSLEHNKYDYKLNFVKWFYNHNFLYENVVIKRRYPAGGCVERTYQLFDIAAPKETWSEALVDYAKELGDKFLLEHPNGVIEPDIFGQWSYISIYDKLKCVNCKLFDFGYSISKDSPDVFEVILKLARTNKTPILVNDIYYFFYNHDM